jgi:hypothetical protein
LFQIIYFTAIEKGELIFFSFYIFSKSQAKINGTVLLAKIWKMATKDFGSPNLYRKGHDFSGQSLCKGDKNISQPSRLSKTKNLNVNFKNIFILVTRCTYSTV